MYEFVTGPLAWIAFGIFIIGMIYRIISVLRLTSKKDKVVFNHLSLGWSLNSIVRWLIPFGSRSMREKYMTLIMVVAAGALLYRRMVAPEVKIVTTAYDYVLWAIAVAPFITGYFAYHQWFHYKTMLIIHILCGEIMLVAIPFTKLSHMFLFFLTRAHIGSEFGQRRGAVTW
jgi:nitrate reductase gamma subunit